MQSLIYDFETLGTNHAESAVVSLAALVFDSSNFNPGYSYDELLTNTISVKFDVADQVRNYGKKIDPRAYLWIDSHSEFQVLVYCDIVKFDTYNKTLPPRITRKLVPVTQPYLQKLQNRRGVVCIITDKPIQSKIKVDWKKHKYATNINRNSLVSFLDDLRR